MERDRGDAGQYEWVNTWAASAAADTSAQAEAPAASSSAPAAVAPKVEIAPPSAPAPVAASPSDQLSRDIAEIERARDALDALPTRTFSVRRTQALTLVPTRTTDAVPIVVGGVLALVMLTVFGAAAAMTKLAR
jgi:hypothetical protein